MTLYDVVKKSEVELELIRQYGETPIELAVKGITGIHSYSNSNKMRYGLPTGAILKEVLHKLPEVPDLLTPDQYQKFLASGPGDTPYTAEEALRIIIVVLEKMFSDVGLGPELAIKRKSGAAYVVLR